MAKMKSRAAWRKQNKADTVTGLGELSTKALKIKIEGQLTYRKVKQYKIWEKLDE